MNSYLVPANAKKSTLIFGVFNKFDLILVSSGVVATILLLLIFSPSNIGTAIICLLPLLVCGFLVIPVPNYHNILTILKEIVNFFYNRRNYKWKGWCFRDEFK